MTSALLTPDICVIGAGSGGLSVAAGAAAFGASVVLIERGRMGGDCLNVGCVPSKALIAAARHAQAMRAAPAFGIRPGGVPEVAFGEVMDHVHRTIAAIAPTDSVERFTALGVTVIKGEARFLDARTVEADGRRIAARRVVIATGSRPHLPELAGLYDVPFLTNETLFDLREPIGHLLVLGGGPIGLEMAQAHRRLGAQVTVVARGRPLPREDSELARMAIGVLRAEGVAIHAFAKAERVERAGSGVRLHLAGPGGRVIEATHLLVATGRRADLDRLDLAAAGIERTAAGVRVDGALRTTNRRVHAIGDAVGPPQFTHLAGHHAALVLRSILFRLPVRLRPETVPRVTFLEPELAQVGLTEDEAALQHGALRVLRWPFHENDRAQAERATTGLVKLVATRRGRLLGAGILGPHAGEQIHLHAMALAKGMSLTDLLGYIAPYPTFGEAGRRAAVQAVAPLARRPGVRRLVGWMRWLG